MAPSRWVVVSVLLLLCVVLVAVAGVVTGDLWSDRPNVVVVSVDSLRADRLGVYGADANLTPNIDRFAEDATVFSEAVAQDTWTLPSEISIAVSQYTLTHQVTDVDRRLPQEAVTLAERMRDRGYATLGLFRKGQATERRIYAQGFDTYRLPAPFSEAPEMVAEWVKGRERPFFAYVMAKNVHEPYDSAPVSIRQQFSPEYSGVLKQFTLGFNGGGFGNDVLRRIRNNSTGYYLIERWNGQVLSQEEVEDRFDTSLSNLDPFIRERLDRINGTHLRVVGRDRTVFLDATDIEYIRDQYSASVHHLDTMFGRFLDALRQEGVYEDTVVVVLSNHGENLADHELWTDQRNGILFGHSIPYRHTVRVPLIVRLPGQERGRRYPGVVELIDVAPTIVDIIDGPQGKGMQGESLLKVIRGQGEEFQRSDQAISKASMIRNESWKLIVRKNRPDLVFDLSRDPRETMNRIQEYPEIQESLSTQLDQERLEMIQDRSRGQE